MGHTVPRSLWGSRPGWATGWPGLRSARCACTPRGPLCDDGGGRGQVWFMLLPVLSHSRLASCTCWWGAANIPLAVRFRSMPVPGRGLASRSLASSGVGWAARFVHHAHIPQSRSAVRSNPRSLPVKARHACVARTALGRGRHQHQHLLARCSNPPLRSWFVWSPPASMGWGRAPAAWIHRSVQRTSPGAGLGRPRLAWRISAWLARIPRSLPVRSRLTGPGAWIHRSGQGSCSPTLVACVLVSVYSPGAWFDSRHRIYSPVLPRSARTGPLLGWSWPASLCCARLGQHRRALRRHRHLGHTLSWGRGRITYSPSVLLVGCIGVFFELTGMVDYGLWGRAPHCDGWLVGSSRASWSSAPGSCSAVWAARATSRHPGLVGRIALFVLRSWPWDGARASAWWGAGWLVQVNALLFGINGVVGLGFGHGVLFEDGAASWVRRYGSARTSRAWEWCGWRGPRPRALWAGSVSVDVDGQGTVGGGRPRPCRALLDQDLGSRVMGGAWGCWVGAATWWRWSRCGGSARGILALGERLAAIGREHGWLPGPGLGSGADSGRRGRWVAAGVGISSHVLGEDGAGVDVWAGRVRADWVEAS
jgi:hypothetical protein